ncbi:hypothetical protein LTR17_008107 [Elasticomyces elasticus]|nr:hypothetical protein LTR17_008107 [Elasticomyces elasticus]
MHITDVETAIIDSSDPYQRHFAPRAFLALSATVSTVVKQIDEAWTPDLRRPSSSPTKKQQHDAAGLEAQQISHILKVSLLELATHNISTALRLELRICSTHSAVP